MIKINKNCFDDSNYSDYEKLVFNIKHGLKARERIIKKFSKNRRQAQFKRVLKQKN